MAETRDSLLRHFATVRSRLTASLDGLSEAQMTEITLDGWSVKDNLAHIAFWDDLRADEIIRISAGFDSVLKMTEQQDHELNAMAYELRRNLSPAQILWELRHSRQRLVDAIGAATARALDPDAYGEAGLMSTHDAQHADYIRNWREGRSI